MMKIRAPYLTLFFAGLLLISACKKDFLDTRMDTLPTPETIQTTRSSLTGFANAFYAPISFAIGFTTLDNSFFEAASDDAQQTLTFAQGVIPFNQATLSEANPSTEANKYYACYEGIRAANFFLDYSKNWKAMISQNRDTLTDVTNYNRDKLFISAYRGEAHVARAYYYSELIKRYGGVPIVTKTLQQAGGDLAVAKSSYDQVVDYIVSEIDTYKDSLVVSWKTNGFSDQDGRFSKGSALAIKARVLLYAASPLHNPSNDPAKWARAAAAAREIISTPAFGYALHTGGYGNYFQGNNSLNSAETILAIRRPASNDLERANYPITTTGGASGVTPSHNLVAEYELKGSADAANIYANRDPRLSETVVLNGSSWNGRTIDQSPGAGDDMAKTNTSRTGYYLKKFLAPNLDLVNNATAQHQWVAIRYAEVLLNYAEAMNEAYGPDGTAPDAPSAMTSRTALNMVRSRVGVAMPAVSTGGKDAFRAAIKHERRIELAFEDHRYWDLLRWNDAATLLNQPIKGVNVSKNANGSFNYTIVDVATRTFRAPAMYYLPFPRAEVVRSNGSITQNPGY
ncbi:MULTISPECIES: RagB/SusD family nutrient uptake outer membrane protein [Pedobacter]|uniref:RagB/SusD family nutrient uptake outer membrane protein n=1 Tax=Pedobacter TaxID=84567 RepID=UPI001FEACD9F|nr:RagB/SusD family nutrient uptake outer membrane protein [Pedobacter nototheniae]